MERIILTDKTEFEILAGASVGNITVSVDNFSGLQTVADALTKAGNLDFVQFESGENITGEYTDMKLESPLFRTVDLSGTKVVATFSIRKKTEMELAIEEIRNGQAVQDGAIADLGDAVSTLAEGGTV